MTAPIGAATWAAYLDHLAELRIPNAVSRLAGMPSRSAFKRHLDRDPIFAARANALWKRRQTDDSVWERLLELLQHHNMAAACAEVGLDPNTLTTKIKHDPVFAARVERLRLRQDLKHLRGRASAATWDRVIKLLATTPFDEVWTQPGVPARYTFFRRLKGDPEFAARVAEATGGRHFKFFSKRQIDVDDDAMWERFLAALTDTTLLELLRQHDMPNKFHFYHRRAADPSFAERVDAILSQRWNRHYTPSEWRNFLSQAGSYRSISAVCQLPGMPCRQTVRKHARKDAEFQADLAATVRLERQKRLAAHAAKRLAAQNAQRLRPDQKFRAQLSRDQLYGAVAAAVPKGLPPITRDDIICDMVLAVLEGHLAVGNLKAHAKEYVREHWRMFGTLRDISIDAAYANDTTKSLHDRLEGHSADYW